MKLSLLIPVLNDEPTLPEIVTRIRALPNGDAHEVLIIFDVTKPEAEARVNQVRDELAARFGAKSLVRTGQRGFGSALRAGAAAATGDAVIPVMGDLCDDLAVIPAMLDKMGDGADVVVGARYIKGGHIIGDTPKQRLSRFYSCLASFFTDVGGGDISNSFKMYRREIWQIVRPRAESFDLSAELIVKAAALGYRVDQVPATWVNRQVGRSNFRLYREVVSYSRWMALAMLCVPSRWTIIAGLGLPLLIRPIARRVLLADSHRTDRPQEIVAGGTELNTGVGETKR
jgi:glycosyltransferase involved in cell wall biosynthesis